MSFLSILGTIAKPITDLVDNLHTSDEEEAQIKAAVFQTQTNLASQVLQYEKQLLDSQKSIIVAEAQGGSWLQRSWRPITMLTFVGLVVARWFGFHAEGMSEKEYLELWGIIKLGIGGYIGGRTIEKVAPKIAESFKK